jgi:Flp pilus assembly protein TadG
VTGRGTAHRFNSEGGQTFVEFAIILPLFFMLVFLVTYAGVAFNRYLRVTDAARVGAKAAAVARFTSTGTPYACPIARSAAIAATDGLLADPDVTCKANGSTVGDAHVSLPGEMFTVEIDYSFDLTLPLLPGAPTIAMTSSAAERVQ